MEYKEGERLEGCYGLSSKNGYPTAKTLTTRLEINAACFAVGRVAAFVPRVIIDLMHVSTSGVGGGAASFDAELTILEHRFLCRFGWMMCEKNE